MAPPATKHHALAIPLPAQGHINPLMRMCETLAAHGFIITFLNVDPIHKRLEELTDADKQQAAESIKPDHHRNLDIRKAHIPSEGIDLSNDFRFSIQQFLEAQDTLIPHIEELLTKLRQEDTPITCVITDFSMSGPAQIVADRFNLPRIALFPSSASTLLLLDYVLDGVLPVQEVLDVVMNSTMDKEKVFKEGLPGLPVLTNGDLPNIKHLEDENLFIYQFLTQKLQNCNERAHAVAVNSFEELEPEELKTLSACLKVPVYGVGPLKGSSTSLWREDEECMVWLDKQPPLSVIFISFGSVALLSQAQFEEILAALLSSGQRFIWVFRPGLLENAPDAGVPPDFLARTREQGRFVKWAPQIRVLSHPSLGAFFTHCGWNSTLEAVAHGVPMLCFPYFYDQFLNAKYVVELWKIGLLFTACGSREDGLVERDAVVKVFKTMMQGEQSEVFRKNAAKLMKAGCQTTLPGGTSYNNVEALMKSL